MKSPMSRRSLDSNQRLSSTSIATRLARMRSAAIDRVGGYFTCGRDPLARARHFILVDETVLAPAGRQQPCLGDPHEQRLMTRRWPISEHAAIELFPAPKRKAARIRVELRSVAAVLAGKPPVV